MSDNKRSVKEARNLRRALAGVGCVVAIGIGFVCWNVWKYKYCSAAEPQATEETVVTDTLAL